MATLYISEFSGWGSFNSQIFQGALGTPPVAEQKLSITTTSTASSTFSSTTHLVLIETDAICSLAWSAGSTTVSATTSAQRMAAGEARIYAVIPGGSVSVVTNT